MRYPCFTLPENNGGNMKKKSENEIATWGVELKVTMNIHSFLQIHGQIHKHYYVSKTVPMSVNNSTQKKLY